MFALQVLLALTATQAINAFPTDWLLPPTDILQFALTLEHLEDKFYREGLANFTEDDFAASGFDSDVYSTLQSISAHETAHVEFLSSALTAADITPVKECTYDFGITTVQQFMALASILEGVGTSAYLGAAALIASKAYLTAAGSILTIEARHSSLLREDIGLNPLPQSQDIPLTPNEVHTLAHGFITSCPKGNPTFPIKAYPGLIATTPGEIKPGQTIDLKTDEYVLKPGSKKARLHAAFLSATGPIWADLQVKPNGMNFQVTVPEGVNGQSYLLLSNCDGVITDASVVAGPTLLEITA